MWRALPDWRFWHFALALSAIAVGVALYRFAIRGQKPSLVREINWLVLGASLSLLPVVCSVPTSRSLLPASIGTSPLIALALLRAYRRAAAWRPGRPRLRAAAALAVLLGGIGTQILLPSLRATGDVFYSARLFRAVDRWVLGAEVDQQAVSRQDVYLVNGIEHTTAVFAPFVRAFHGLPLPRSWRVLSSAPHAHDVARTASNRLEMQVLGGVMMHFDLETFYRAERLAFRRGDRVDAGDLRVEIVSLMHGKPQAVRFVFAHGLEDPRYLFLCSSESGFTRFILPPIGGTVRLPKATFPY